MASAEGAFDEAEAHFRFAIELGEELLPRAPHRFIVGAKSEYADMLLAAGRAEEASVVLEDVLDLRMSSIGPDHPLTVRTLETLQRARSR